MGCIDGLCKEAKSIPNDKSASSSAQWYNHFWGASPKCFPNTRTSLDMDGTLTLIFANSVTTQDIITKISASFQLSLEWILTKFEGCGLKSKGATPIRSFLHSWREIQILSTYDLDFLYKAGFHRGWQLVKIWCRYL